MSSVKEKIEKLKEILREIEGTCIFSFEAISEPRKGFPYVATLKAVGNRIEREFKDLSRDFSRREVRVWGEYKAKNGDVIEEQYEASWKNKYRRYSIIKDCEKLVFEDIKADEFNIKIKPLILPYLKGEITLEEFLKNEKIQNGIEFYIDKKQKGRRLKK